MAFDVIASCAICKFASSQVFYDAKKQRICMSCIQAEHDKAYENLERSFAEMFKLTEKVKVLEAEIQAHKDKLDVIKGIVAPVIET